MQKDSATALMRKGAGRDPSTKTQVESGAQTGTHSLRRPLSSTIKGPFKMRQAVLLVAIVTLVCAVTRRPADAATTATFTLTAGALR
jgi:hypothetical protein